MTDEEELKAALDAVYEAEMKLKEEFEEAKQLFKEQGLYKGDFSNFEDDYKGYILLPMKDGKYWCFYYVM